MRCGGMFNDCFITRLLLSLMVKEFWKLVNIWWSYGQEKGVLFFDSRGTLQCGTNFNVTHFLNTYRFRDFQRPHAKNSRTFKDLLFSTTFQALKIRTHKWTFKDLWPPSKRNCLPSLFGADEPVGLTVANWDYVCLAASCWRCRYSCCTASASSQKVTFLLVSK